MIIPSIDLMNGKAVQLKQGKEKIIEREDVLELAKEFRKFGEIAVVDLDSALGNGNNIELIKKICRIAECRVGGGIRTLEKANEILMAGAKKIIIGTKATPEFLRRLPKGRVIVAIDTKDDKIVNKGWRNMTSRTPEELIKELEPYCSEFLFTNVNIEGTMAGCDFGKVRILRELTKNKLTIAGGISTIEEIKALEDMNLNSQLGMALYSGRLELDDIFISLVDFNKCSGLVPTIAQDANGQVLMLAYSTKESLKKTFKKGLATYYSRSRKKQWTKGETSGNVQELISARFDCDRDTILFKVAQKNNACHTESYSCFGDKEFYLSELYSTLVRRIKNRKESSYTSKLAEDEKLLYKKIIEEAQEVINYTDRNNLVWEIADLTYFIMVLMAKQGIAPQEIVNELWRRRR